jgi:hypothetical protein
VNRVERVEQVEQVERVGLNPRNPRIQVSFPFRDQRSNDTYSGRTVA